jgi:hypothetical protein
MKLLKIGLRPIALQMRAQTLCRGKYRHRSQGMAEAAMRSLIRQGLDRPAEGRLNTYRCPRCFSWHVGHTRSEEGSYACAV